MKNLIVALLGLLILSACVVGDFKEDRVRLHNLGKKDICQTKPDRCIEGTQIDW